ncbi:hypothetical protein PCANC_09793 [Puccinia coronata f. sp. avenae]|uniref:Uncharacterized protein n=1 Tax=Puccinia coronata f. sp. avenae TaxID=200324 RepID=A0A2N5VT41_9BASI|nr:hypothetical protein PCANC_09793 [Puccinia coronata f. sp. avenae]
MPVEHSPKPKSSTVEDLPPGGMAPPSDGQRYTKDEIAGMSTAHRSSANTSSDRMGDLTITLQQLLTGKGPHHSGATDGRCEAGDPGSRPPRRFASLGAPSGNRCEQGPQGLAQEGLP